MFYFDQQKSHLNNFYKTFPFCSVLNLTLFLIQHVIENIVRKLSFMICIIFGFIIFGQYPNKIVILGGIVNRKLMSLFIQNLFIWNQI